MISISVRTRGDVRNVVHPHYKNFDVQRVDGVSKLVERDPVASSLASEFSISMNAMLHNPSSPRSRMNVDAVDLLDNINKIK